MVTNGTLQLATNYIQTGLGTLTYTVPSTIPPNNISVSNIPFVVQCQVTLPLAIANGFGAGSGADQGLGVTGGVSGIGQGSYFSLGQGGLGLGFGGSMTDGASGVGSGHGAGAGGGTLAEFSQGGGGLGNGSTGQGLGPSSSGYQQPPVNVVTPAAGTSILSSVVITVKQNGTTVYTAPTVAGIQSALQFSTSLLCNAADSITVVFSSSNLADSALNVIQANVSIGVGNL